MADPKLPAPASPLALPVRENSSQRPRRAPTVPKKRRNRVEANEPRERRVATRAPLASSLFVRVRHEEAGWGRGVLVAVAPNRIAFQVAAASFPSGGVAEGDLLPDVTLFTQRGRAYEGAAEVLRVDRQGPELVLELQTEFAVDVALTEDAILGEKMSPRFGRIAAEFGGGTIPAGYHAFVSSLRYDLEKTASFLDEEEAKWSGHDPQRREAFTHILIRLSAPTLAARMHQAAREGETLLAGVSPRTLETAREFTLASLAPLLRRSPFFRRARVAAGRAGGDDEMRMMIERSPDEGTSVFARIVNRYLLGETIAVSRRNQSALLADRIEATARGVPDGMRAHICAIGAHQTYALALVLSRAPHLGKKLAVLLVDNDDEVLDAAARRLSPIARHTEMRFRTARERVADLSPMTAMNLGQFDLVIAAERFDNTSDRQLRNLVHSLRCAVAPGGTLLVGSVSTENPSRFAMEYFADWRVHHRTRNDLLALAAGLKPQATSDRENLVSVEAEPLGVGLFLRVDVPAK